MSTFGVRESTISKAVNSCTGIKLRERQSATHLITMLKAFCHPLGIPTNDLIETGHTLSMQKACCHKICEIATKASDSIKDECEEWMTVLTMWENANRVRDDVGISNPTKPNESLHTETLKALTALMDLQTTRNDIDAIPATQPLLQPKIEQHDNPESLIFGRCQYDCIVNESPTKSPEVIDSATGRKALLSLNENDVLLGRGNGIQSFHGNQLFRHYVFDHKDMYVNARRHNKSRIAVLLIAHVMRQDPPGRFIESIGDECFCISYERAVEKASQALREKKLLPPPGWIDQHKSDHKEIRSHTQKDRRKQSTLTLNKKNLTSNLNHLTSQDLSMPLTTSSSDVVVLPKKKRKERTSKLLSSSSTRKAVRQSLPLVSKNSNDQADRIDIESSQGYHKILYPKSHSTTAQEPDLISPSHTDIEATSMDDRIDAGMAAQMLSSLQNHPSTTVSNEIDPTTILPISLTPSATSTSTTPPTHWNTPTRQMKEYFSAMDQNAVMIRLRLAQLQVLQNQHSTLVASALAAATMTPSEHDEVALILAGMETMHTQRGDCPNSSVTTETQAIEAFTNPTTILS